MAVLDLRQRAGSLFLAVMLGHILLISAQVNSHSGVPVIESVTFSVFSEIQRVLTGGTTGIRRFWSGYVDLRHVKAENDSLRRDLAAAQVASQQERALAERSRYFQRLLDLRDRSHLKMTAAEIVAAGASPDFRTLTIDRGARDGLKPNMAVIGAAGVVGRVIVAGFRSAQVQMLLDRNAAAGALIERSRAQGVAVGRGDDRLQMEYVSEVADILVGDPVVTSGIDGIFPKGFTLGRVEAIDKRGPTYERIIIKPAIDFASLEEVLVVTTPVTEAGE